MAENFIQLTNNVRRIEDVGDDYLRQLLARSLLEPMDESFVTMHGLMRGLAQLLSGQFALRNELQSSAKSSERAWHFSYVVDLMIQSPNLKPFKKVGICELSCHFTI